MSDTTRPPLPSNFNLTVSPQANLRGAVRTGPSSSITERGTSQREYERMQASVNRVGRGVGRAARATARGLSRAARWAPSVAASLIFSPQSGIARLLRPRPSRGAQPRYEGQTADYQNASSMDSLPPSMEAERVQEVQSQSTLNSISETLLRIENTLNNMVASRSSIAGSAPGSGEAAGGGILGLLGSIIGGMGAAAAGGLAALGPLITRTIARVARAIFTRIPIIGPLILVALNIEGAMEEYERNGLGAAITDLIAGIGSDLTFGIISKERIKEILDGAISTLSTWWDSATTALGNVVTSIVDSVKGFFGWISNTIQDFLDRFTRRRRELEEQSERGREEVEQNLNNMTPGQRAGRGPGTTAAARLYQGELTESELDRVMQALETAPEGETEEQRVLRTGMLNQLQSGTGRATPEMVQYAISRGTLAVGNIGASLDEELNFNPQEALQAADREIQRQTQENAPVLGYDDTAGEDITAQIQRQVMAQALQVEESERSRDAAEIAREIEVRQNQELTGGITTDEDAANARIDAVRVRSNLARIGRSIDSEMEFMNEAVARGAAAEAVEPGEAETPEQSEAEATQATVAGIVTTDEDAVAAIARLITRQAPAIVPPENANERARALADSVPGPSVIPVVVPQGAGGGGSGGGAAQGGGQAAPTGGSGRAAAPPPPVFPMRPADFVSPAVSN